MRIELHSGCYDETIVVPDGVTLEEALNKLIPEYIVFIKGMGTEESIKYIMESIGETCDQSECDECGAYNYTRVIDV